MKINQLSKVCLFAFCVLLLGSGLQAQSTVTGVVRDASGGVLPGVEVLFTYEESGFEVTALTNSAGIYRQIDLPAGAYTIEARLPGFKSSVSQVQLDSFAEHTIDFSMEIGEISEQVTVEATGVTLEKQAPQVSTFFEEKIVRNMPMIYRRSNMLLQLSAAVTNATPHIDNPMYTANTTGGVPNAGQEYYMDGGYTSSSRANQQITDFASNLETTQEFRVVQNSHKAEYSGGGGLIIMTTKSGTNEFHGSVWEYHRQRVLTARNFFAAEREPFREHLFGTTVGGPIAKDKIHFFFGFESKHNWENSVAFQTLPTAAQQAGDFSGKFNSDGSLRTIYDPFSSVVAPDGSVTRTALPGNIIPQNRLNPIARQIMDFIPDPNIAPADVSGSLNFRGFSQKFRRVYDWMGRIDSQVSQSDKVFARFSIARWRAESEGAWPGLPGFPARYAAADPDNFVSQAKHGVDDINPADPGGRPDTWRSTNLTTGWTHTFGPELVSDFRSSYQRMEQWAAGASQGLGYPQELGVPIPGVIDLSFDHFPAIIVDDGYTMPSPGWAGGGHAINPRDATHFGDTIAWLKGNHSFKFGGQIRYSRHRYFRHPYSSGQYSFSRKASAADPFDAGSGDSIASLLFDFPIAGDIWSIEERRFFSWYYSYFVQDDWRISPNVVLNLGMRYEFDSPVDEHQDLFTGFNTAGVNPVCNCPGTITFGGVDHPYGGAHNSTKANFQPRGGLAWNPDGGKTVVRLGAGIYFMPPYTGMGPWNTIGAARPDIGVQRAFASPDNGITRPYGGLTSGLPEIAPFEASQLNPGFGAVPIGDSPILSPDFLDPNHKAPRSYHMSLTVQHELEDFLLEAGWIANLTRGYGTWNAYNLNQVRPEVMARAAAGGTPPTQLDRPFPQFNNVEQRSSGGTINYHAMILKAEKRFSGGLGFVSNLTWSKHLMQSTNRLQDFYNRARDYGPAADQRRLRFVWGGTYELPLGIGRQYMTDGLAAQVLGGWNLGTIFQAQSGAPLTFSATPNQTSAFGGALRPNLVGNPEGAKNINSWFNVAAFEHPGSFVFGDAGTGLIEGPGLWQVDFSLTKDFVWGEDKSIRFGADFFNAFNHANFGNPSTSIFPAGSPGTTNLIRSAQPGRRIQMALTFRW